MPPLRPLWANPTLALMLVLGFSSGLPLALTSGTLQAWLATGNLATETVSLFTLVGLPYTLKFLWAPFMDRYALPLGRRRGWMVVTQLLLVVVILAMATTDPSQQAPTLALLALAVALLSASQDVAIDAYRAETLRPSERGLGSAVSVVGYRLAMLASGAGALIIAQFYGFSTAYSLMALLLLVGPLAAWLGSEPPIPVTAPRTLRGAVWEPLAEFFNRPNAWALLAIIVCYKLGDAFAGSLSTLFLIRGMGFSVGEVGAVNKGLGLLAALAGGLVGGTLMARLGLYRSLLTFGVLQGISNLAFAALAAAGKSYPLMLTAVGLENLAGGMGTAAFVALLMSLCDSRYTATQFALLSALAALGRVYVGPVSGVLVETWGWTLFFVLTVVAALPGLGLLIWFRQRIESLDFGAHS